MPVLGLILEDDELNAEKCDIYPDIKIGAMQKFKSSNFSE